jgi:TRAP-type C4-dicarboxylate transport system permease small subunit
MFEELRLRLSRLVEFAMAALLAAIFITFLLQIFARYAPNLAFLVPI